MPAKKTATQRNRTLTTDSTPKAVIFRLDAQQRLLLDERAKGDGLDANAWAKAAVLDALNKSADARSPHQLVEGQVRILRKELAMVAEALLLAIKTDKSITPQEVKTWVEMTLNRD